MAKKKGATGRVLHDPIEDRLTPIYPLDLSRIRTTDDLVRAMGQTAYTARQIGDAADVLGGVAGPVQPGLGENPLPRNGGIAATSVSGKDGRRRQRAQRFGRHDATPPTRRNGTSSAAAGGPARDVTSRMAGPLMTRPRRTGT